MFGTGTAVRARQCRRTPGILILPCVWPIKHAGDVGTRPHWRAAGRVDLRAYIPLQIHRCPRRTRPICGTESYESPHYSTEDGCSFVDRKHWNAHQIEGAVGLLQRPAQHERRGAGAFESVQERFSGYNRRGQHECPLRPTSTDCRNSTGRCTVPPAFRDMPNAFHLPRSRMSRTCTGRYRCSRATRGLHAQGRERNYLPLPLPAASRRSAGAGSSRSSRL